MKSARIIAATALLASGWTLYAKPAQPAGPLPQDLVAARQAGMDLSAATMGSLRAASGNGVPLKNLAFPASGLAKWAKVMPTLFADSTKGLPSRAKPEIWSDKPGFAARAKALADATQALAAAAAAEDKAGFDAALASTGAACKGCHETFQVPPPAAKPG